MRQEAFLARVRVGPKTVNIRSMRAISPARRNSHVDAANYACFLASQPEPFGFSEESK